MTRPLEIRRAAVAGSRYPSDPDTLALEVDRYLSAVDDPPVGEALAIVAPHAGLMYSGPIAAHAYSLLRGRDFDVAFLVGPSHYVGFEGVAIYERGAFETPFGKVPISEECAAAVMAASQQVKSHPLAHGREHSIEMQLPFLSACCVHLTSSVVMGSEAVPTPTISADPLPRQPRPGVLARRDTDLSHYQQQSWRRNSTAQFIPSCSGFPEGLMTCWKHSRSPAGGGPTVSV